MIAEPPTVSPQAITAWKAKADKLVAMDSQLGAAKAALEEKLRPIREQHDPEIEKLEQCHRALASEFREFGKMHAEMLFAEGSVIKTKTAIITGKVTPAAVAVDEDLDTADVIEVLKADRKLKDYLECKWSLARAKIKSALANKGPHTDLLTEAGLSLQSGFSVSVKSKGD